MSELTTGLLGFHSFDGIFVHDLANFSLSSVSDNDCQSLDLLTEPEYSSDLSHSSSNSITSVPDYDISHCSDFPIPSISNRSDIEVFRRSREFLDAGKKGDCGETFKDHVKVRYEKKTHFKVQASRCYLPFLIGAPRMDECLVCRFFVYPGEELKCSVVGCKGVYHMKCAKQNLEISNLKKFKCSQHACFVCKKKSDWMCTRCTVASHDKCAPWPHLVLHLQGQHARAVCWRHPEDWRLDRNNQASTASIEEIFCRLPIPYTDEEFKIDLALENEENKLEPPPYTLIRRNVYLIKKKRSDADTGCAGCNSMCTENCVCRVQLISCSKACRCSVNCTNRPFRKEKKIKVVKTELCGWGAEAVEPIYKGELVIEYVGEVIDDTLCVKRLWEQKCKGEQNVYMCELRKNFTIDATFKGNASRFLNHSCDPNCLLEKWQVDGDVRVGIFAARQIEAGEPLTYDYRFVQFGAEVQCQCGAPNCQGFLGNKRKIGKIDFVWGSKRRRTSNARIAAVPV